MGISHRGLKPENLLITELGIVKISDFGLSHFLNANGLVSTPCGSPCYASPECTSRRDYDGITTDVWSSGVILYAILCGQLPWTKRNQTQLFQQVKRGEYSIPAYLSDSAADFLRRLLTVDPKKRITFEEALNHPWLRGTPTQFILSDFKPKLLSLRRVDRVFRPE